MAFEWGDFRDRILDGLKPLAEQTVGDALDAARTDTEVFLEGSRQKLEFWTRALARGELDRDEFELLVGARMTNLTMLALQTAGVTQNALERLRQGLVSLVIDTAFDLVL